MGADAFEAEYTAGRDLTTEEAIQLALDGQSSANGASSADEA